MSQNEIALRCDICKCANATIYHSVEDEFTFIINQTTRTVAKTADGCVTFRWPWQICFYDFYRPLVYSSQLTNRSSRVKLHKTMEVSARPSRENDQSRHLEALSRPIQAREDPEKFTEKRDTGNPGTECRRLPPVHPYSKAHNFSHRSCRRNEPDH